jgi:hypothetical protein
MATYSLMLMPPTSRDSMTWATRSSQAVASATAMPGRAVTVTRHVARAWA